MPFPKFLQKRNSKKLSFLNQNLRAEGICFDATEKFPEIDAIDWIEQIPDGSDTELCSYLGQLVEEGYANFFDEEIVIPWEDFYALGHHQEHQESLSIISLPNLCPLHPVLNSQGSLFDQNFSISIEWLDKQQSQGRLPSLSGGILTDGDKSYLLQETSWLLASEIRRFNNRSTDERSQQQNELHWGRLRTLANQAHAQLDDFLTHSVVLTVDQLELQLRQTFISGSRVVELEPVIEGVDKVEWLSQFDRYGNVQPHYIITSADGTVTRVLLDKPVQRVLAEVKAMPGRRVAGRKAQALIRNPFATLGEDACQVLDPDAFERALNNSGIVFHEFALFVDKNESGHTRFIKIVLLIDKEATELIEEDPKLLLSTRDNVEKFRAVLMKGIRTQDVCITWKSIDLELQGNARKWLELIENVLLSRWETDPEPLKMGDILNLENYSDRIYDIGVYKPPSVDYIQREDGSPDWMPEAPPVIEITAPGSSEPIQKEITEEDYVLLKKAVEEAGDAKVIEFSNSGIPIDTERAAEIVRTFSPVFEKVVNTKDDANWDDEKSPEASTEIKRQPNLELLYYQNITNDEYAQRRAEVLAFDPKKQPQIPKSLLESVELKTYQLSGLTWLQQLYSHAPEVGGCVFADDMGLGKTLQLLSFMAWYQENDPAPKPALVIAPVALLENWQNEIKKFFGPNMGKITVLHGSAASKAMVPRHEIDPALLEMNLNKFLKDGWADDSHIVLTTYDTVRNLEFSLASNEWGIMVCDEAQYIKNPTAARTRSVKKQNAAFKIACTGTPVENNLADLWSLFDFIQPGFLGALNFFSKTYRRPIEAQCEKDAAAIEAIEQLRKLIEPQVLRRMKYEVADLPPKLEDKNCRNLILSKKQQDLYARVVGQFKENQSDGGDEDGAPSSSPRNMILGILHEIRMICAAAKERGLQLDISADEALYKKHSPKMDWLLTQLGNICQKSNDEKVIIFSEFREIQRLIQRFVHRKFDIKASIINGDSKTDGSMRPTRQKMIDMFQNAPGFNVIILSPLAVGFGVNIQAANHVIHFTRSWNPAKEDQATDRAYRIGQTRPVHVYYPTVRASDFTTFEEKLDLLLSSKRELATDMLNGAADISLSEFGDIEGSDGTVVKTQDRVTPEWLDRMEPNTFENLCAVLWRKQGFDARVTRQPGRRGDGGVDVVAIKKNDGVLIQCKTARDRNKKLGWDAVKEVVGGSAAYSDRHPGIKFRKIVATNRSFNSNAKEQAALNKVEVYEFNDLSELISNYEITSLEIT